MLDFKNVVHLPILDFPDDMLVLEAIPPKEWPSSLHIPIQPFHGGHFNGNDCMKFLRGVSKLQLLSEKENFVQAHGFIQTITLFKDVVTSCFGQNLDPDYESKIAQFQQSYIKLPISVTPKAHAVFFHVLQFIKTKKMGLGLFSEQATEALHSNFKVHWDRYKRDSSHPDYTKHLLKCVTEYNSKKI